MNYTDRLLRETASYSVLDVMLADIAIRIQLTPTDYQAAIAHYETINEWIDRDESPLHGRVQLLYSQGGFMIGATFSRSRAGTPQPWSARSRNTCANCRSSCAAP
jgi:hypothetical protein